MVEKEQPPRMGRIPVGKVCTLRFERDTKAQLDELADRFGQRRAGAVVRVAVRRMLRSPERGIEEDLHEGRRLAAEARLLPLVDVKIQLDPRAQAHLLELADQEQVSVSVLVRVAIDRLLRHPGPRLAGPLSREAASKELGPVIEIGIRAAQRDAITALAETKTNGKAARSAALRVGIRRLLNNPGDIAADVARAEALRLRDDVRPEVYAESRIYLDDTLRDGIDRLTAQFDCSRAELVRLAVKRLIRHPGKLEEAVIKEVYVGTANRAKLIARHKRREQTRKQQPDLR